MTAKQTRTHAPRRSEQIPILSVDPRSRGSAWAFSQASASKMANDHVLVVESDVLTRVQVSNHLRETGFVVIEAASADDAWAFMSVEGVVDLVFAEIATPGALDGLALARAVATRFIALPVLLTGDAADAPPPGPWSFIAKPYALERVETAISEALGLIDRKDEP